MAYSPSVFAKPFKAPRVVHAPRPAGGYIPRKAEDNETPLASTSNPTSSRQGDVPVAIGKTIAQQSFYAAPKAVPKKEKIFIGEKSNKERLGWGGSLHDPKSEGAVVMPRPKEDGLIMKEARRRRVKSL